MAPGRVRQSDAADAARAGGRFARRDVPRGARAPLVPVRDGRADVGTTAAARSYFDNVLPTVPEPLSTQAEVPFPPFFLPSPRIGRPFARGSYRRGHPGRRRFYARPAPPRQRLEPGRRRSPAAPGASARASPARFWGRRRCWSAAGPRPPTSALPSPRPRRGSARPTCVTRIRRRGCRTRSAEFGRIDVLICNAGGSPEAPAATASPRSMTRSSSST